MPAFEVAKAEDRTEWGQFIARFIDKNGYFTVKIHKRGEGEQIFPELTITRPVDSSISLHLLKDYFDCGEVHVRTGRKDRYRIRSYRDMIHRIVPFFEAYGLKCQTQRNNFERLREVVEIMVEKQHLQVEGFERVRAIVAHFRYKQSPPVAPLPHAQLRGYSPAKRKSLGLPGQPQGGAYSQLCQAAIITAMEHPADLDDSLSTAVPADCRDTVAALSSGTGRSGVAVIRLSGPGAGNDLSCH